MVRGLIRWAENVKCQVRLALARWLARAAARVIIHADAGKVRFLRLAQRHVVWVPPRGRRTDGHRLGFALAIACSVLWLGAAWCSGPGACHLEVICPSSAHAAPRLAEMPCVRVHTHWQTHSTTTSIEVAVLRAQPPAIAVIARLPPSPHTGQTPAARRGPLRMAIARFLVKERGVPPYPLRAHAYISAQVNYVTDNDRLRRYKN